MAESLNDFVAGWIGGAAGIIVGSPLDVLKARLQAPRSAAGPAPTAWQTMIRMVEYEGFNALFKGVLAPVMGLAGLNALLFVSYGGILRAMEPAQSTNYQPSLAQVYLAGCGAGIASFLFSTPTELVKIQAQMSRVPKSSLQVSRDIFERSGFRGFYQGGWITMIRDAPSYGIYFWVYEGLKRALEVDKTEGASGSNAWKLLLAGGMAGAVSWTSIYPIDVIKSRLQMQIVTPPPSFAILPSNQATVASRSYSSSSRNNGSLDASIKILNSPAAATAESTILSGRLDRPYTSIKDCIVRSYAADGIGVFFRGLWPTILRGFPVNAVTFWVYEVVLEALESNILR